MTRRLQLELAEARDRVQGSAEEQQKLQLQVASLKQSLAATETGASSELLRLQDAAAAAASSAAAAAAAADAVEREKAALMTRVRAAEAELMELNAAVRLDEVCDTM